MRYQMLALSSARFVLIYLGIVSVFAGLLPLSSPSFGQTLSEILQLKGVFEQGGYVLGYADPSDQIHLGGRKIRISKDGRFIIGFHRDADTRQVLSLTRKGTVLEQLISIEVREYDIQRIDGLPPKKVSPPEETLSRIRAEAESVWIARDIDSPLTAFATAFSWPLKGDPGIITGVYGSQRVLNGKPRQPHYGVDIAAPTGTPVYAPAGGQISFLNKDMYFSGGTFMIDHGHGLASTFLHMETIDVALGDFVEKGQRIGTVGETGRATGPHLDWRINWFQNRLDPMHFAKPPQ